jgi:hypothetical protein
MVCHDHLVLHLALHGTPVHFAHIELLFSHMNTVQIYMLPFQNEIASAFILVCKMHVLFCTYTPI